MKNTNNEFQEHDSLNNHTEYFSSIIQDCEDDEKVDMEDFLMNCEKSDTEYWAAEKKESYRKVQNIKNTNVLIPKIPGTQKFRFSYFNYIVHRKDQFEKFIDCLAERGFMFLGWRNETTVLNVLYNNIKYNVIDYFQENYNVSLIADVACSLLSPEWLFSTYGKWDRSGKLIGGEDELKFIQDRIENIFYGIDGPVATTFYDSIKRLNMVINNKYWPEHSGFGNDSDDKCIIQQIYTSDDPRYWDQ